jgi:hypothetical protein
MVPNDPEDRASVPSRDGDVLLGLDLLPATGPGGRRSGWVLWTGLGLLTTAILLGGAHLLVPEREGVWGVAGGWSDGPSRLASGPERAADGGAPAAAVDPATGLRLVVWSGNGQEGVPGRPLRRALAVVVRDSADRPVQGADVVFRVAGGGGRVEPQRVATSDLGLAATTWWLGQQGDSLRVTAHLPGASGLRVEFRAAYRDGVVVPRESALQEVQLGAADGDDVPAEASARAAAVAREDRTQPAPASDASRRPAAAAPRSAPATATLTIRTTALVSAGGAHTCRLEGGRPVCWGGDGRTGHASGAPSDAPRLEVVRSGMFHTCGITSGGRVYCWPTRGAAQTTSEAPGVELALPGGAAAVDVVAGSEHSCALSADGAVYCWGGNAHGQLGDGSGSDASSPVRVEGLPRVTQLTAGWLHTCARTSDGRAFCWGSNARGQLGNGSSTDRNTAVAVAQGEPFTFLSAGSAHTCGIARSGAAWCWGSNEHGQLGTGAGQSELSPRRVAGAQRFRALAAGGVHTCALTAEGTAWCWGRNTFGQLGTGSTVNAPVPAAVAQASPFVALAAGGAHTCGETATGRVYCWGNNVQGQVGDGTREDRSVPVPTTGEETR